MQPPDGGFRCDKSSGGRSEGRPAAQPQRGHDSCQTEPPHKTYPEILNTTQNTFTHSTTSKPSHSTKQLRTTLTIASGHRGTPQQHRERPGRRKTARRGRERKGNLELEKGASQKDETEMREKREREGGGEGERRDTVDSLIGCVKEGFRGRSANWDTNLSLILWFRAGSLGLWRGRS